VTACSGDWDCHNEAISNSTAAASGRVEREPVGSLTLGGF